MYQWRMNGANRTTLILGTSCRLKIKSHLSCRVGFMGDEKGLLQVLIEMWCNLLPVLLLDQSYLEPCTIIFPLKYNRKPCSASAISPGSKNNDIPQLSMFGRMSGAFLQKVLVTISSIEREVSRKGRLCLCHCHVRSVCGNGGEILGIKYKVIII